MIMAYTVDKRGLANLLFDGITKDQAAFAAEEGGRIVGKALTQKQDKQNVIIKCEAQNPDVEKMLLGAVMTYSDTNGFDSVRCEDDGMLLSCIEMGFDKDSKEMEVDAFFTSGCACCHAEDKKC